MCHVVRNSPGSIRTSEDEVDMVRAVAVEVGGTSGPGNMPGNLCMCVCMCVTGTGRSLYAWSPGLAISVRARLAFLLTEKHSGGLRRWHVEHSPHVWHVGHNPVLKSASPRMLHMKSQMFNMKSQMQSLLILQVSY